MSAEARLEHQQRDAQLQTRIETMVELEYFREWQAKKDAVQEANRRHDDNAVALGQELGELIVREFPVDPAEREARRMERFWAKIEAGWTMPAEAEASQ